MQLLTLFIITFITVANAGIPMGTNGVAACFCPAAGCVNGVCSTVVGLLPHSQRGTQLIDGRAGLAALKNSSRGRFRAVFVDVWGQYVGEIAGGWLKM